MNEKENLLRKNGLTKFDENAMCLKCGFEGKLQGDYRPFCVGKEGPTIVICPKCNATLSVERVIGFKFHILELKKE